MLDDQATPTTNTGVYIFPTVAGSSNNMAVGNSVPVANLKRIDTVTSTYAANWLVRMDVPAYSALTGKALSGSTITDLSTGVRYVQTTPGEGTNWLAQAPTAGYGARLTPGYYFGAGAATRSTLSMAASTEYACPVFISGSGTLIRIGLEVTIAGTAGTVIRLGIRGDNGTGQPGDLLLDAGAVAGDAVASVELTISTAVTPGLYWFTATAQSTGGTLPTVRAMTGDLPPVGVGALATALSSTPLAGYLTGATITGALPTTYTVSNRAGVVPRIVAKA